MNLQRVDLNLLVHLDVLLREKNVTRAAEQLGITQLTFDFQTSELDECIRIMEHLADIKK